MKWANAVPLRPPGQVARLDALGQRGGVAWRRDTGGRKRDFIRVGGAVTAGALIDPPAISGSFNVSPVGCFAGWAIVMVHEYDMIVFGGGVAGLWVANTLKRAGYNVIVIEKDKLGAGQTLASQGMIHGGQKYLLQGVMTSHAAVASKMPARWQANFDGRGEIDLTSVRVLSETQIMWPAGSILSAVTVLGAAKLLKTRSRMLTKDVFPDALKNKKEFKGPVYMLPEKVVDMRSLIIALAKNLAGRVLKGEINDMRPDGAGRGVGAGAPRPARDLRRRDRQRARAEHVEGDGAAHATPAVAAGHGAAAALRVLCPRHRRQRLAAHHRHEFIRPETADTSGIWGAALRRRGRTWTKPRRCGLPRRN